MIDEGVVKFAADHTHKPLTPDELSSRAHALLAWRKIMVATGMVGQDPQRYAGAGYGNASVRLQPGRQPFLITGTQTGGIADLAHEQLCVVDAYDLHHNKVHSHGPVKPSSESMTHGAIYDLSPRIQVVLHAHSPEIWQRATELGIPVTNPNVPYGTPAMAIEVHRLYNNTRALAEHQVLAMGGHGDGIITFGTSFEVAGQTLLTRLANAYQREAWGR